MTLGQRTAIRKTLKQDILTAEEERIIKDIAVNCLNYGEDCPSKCPMNEYRAGLSNEEKNCWGRINCIAFFARACLYLSPRNTANDSNSDLEKYADKNDFSSVNELANQVEKLAKEIKIKVKRDTPMRVVVSHSNGKTIYHCYNCGKPLFIQPSTQYCECCGQKLSFEVVEK